MLNIHGVRASSVAQVQIEIIDLNDNRPEFYKCEDSCEKADHFTGEVFEQSLGSISFNMTVKDSDKVRIKKTNNTKKGPSLS